ncbi:MAG TPA: histidine--tRNA ligase [Candidatus Saccharimonadales bacterium]|nr:histidine--tRNA ligase [Candidatus Saccharimonadales bacterium]
MALSTQPYKGARDFYPADKRLQKYMFNTLRDVAERFGYEEYDAPILEPLELYLAKTGEEIVNEQTYTFEDRGGRRVAMRPEMTPTVSRMVAAKRQELAYPLRWYSIPNLWRYERPQRGRLREHWQLNVDLFGLAGIEAEHEIILVVDTILKTFGATHDMYTIRLNSRKLSDALLKDYLKLDDVQAHSLSKLIDRKDKMDHAAFLAQVDALFTPSEREAGLVEKLLAVLEAKSVDALPDELKSHSSVAELQKLLTLLADSHVTNVVFDPSLMRGFDYYTDIVFEVFDNHPDNNRSMFGGGRYDGLVGLFGVEPVPTIGFGMGDVTLANFLQIHDLLPPIRTETDIYVVLVGNVFEKAQKPIAEMREMGLNVAVDLSGRKVGAQIKTAEKKGIHYIVTIGAKELEAEQFPVKNIMTGIEETHSLQRIVTIVKDYRNV